MVQRQRLSSTAGGHGSDPWLENQGPTCYKGCSQKQKRKCNLTKIKGLCTTKENISKMKRQSSECEKIIANEATNEELISKIHKHTCSSISEKYTTQSTNGPKN